MPPCKARIPTLGGVINATGIETRTRMSKSGKQFLAASLENTRNSPSRGAPTLPQGSSACSGHVVLTSIVNGSPRNTWNNSVRILRVFHKKINANRWLGLFRKLHTQITQLQDRRRRDNVLGFAQFCRTLTSWSDVICCCFHFHQLQDYVCCFYSIVEWI